MLVAPSILSCDFGRINEEISAICKTDCDFIHVDVMDGHFVPNLTIGPVVVESVNKISSKPLDIHFMVQNNTFFVELFKDIKPEFITFHIEEEKHPHRLIQKIKDYGIKAGVVLNPHTNPSIIEYLIEYLDIVLLMSVNPGFGGQSFISNVLEKSKVLKEMIEKRNPKCLIEIDGGVNDKNIHLLKESGVDMVVAGNYIFKSSDYSQAVKSLKI
ncbi:MAG: ribulose-phosphate 3-epimerase [Campylobacterales bacterium]|nr:ribulose-phosphate 3-epimerase [Campylobacterales bacterium]